MKDKLQHYKKKIEKIIDDIGLNMPNIGFIIGCFYILLRGGCVQKFIIFFVFNLIINQILKHYLKHPRPVKAVVDGSIPGNSYGMPSGHAQMVTFIFAYLLFLYPDNMFLPILSIFSIYITINQRIKYHKHTPLQTAAGFIVGIISAFIFSNTDIYFIE